MFPKLKKFHYIHHLNPLIGSQHSHPFHEFVYCIKGKGRIEISGKSFYFGTGTIYITEAGIIHFEEDYTESEIIYFYFDCPVSMINMGVFYDKNETVLPILRKLQSEVRTEKHDSELMKSAILQQLLIETKRTRDYHKQGRSFGSVLEYIDECFRYEINVRELAKKCGYSYDRFRHIFKEQTGVSPNEYIIQKRVEMAKKMMENNVSASLTYIAYECGFATSSHFSNAFKSLTGKSPKDYKKYIQKFNIRN